MIDLTPLLALRRRCPSARVFARRLIVLAEVRAEKRAMAGWHRARREWPGPRRERRPP